MALTESHRRIAIQALLVFGVWTFLAAFSSSQAAVYLAQKALLDPARFVRVHRSAIINVDRLKKLQPYFHGEYVVTLHDGTTLTSSRTYSDRLRALVAFP
jgi:hypothetical protein